MYANTSDQIAHSDRTVVENLLLVAGAGVAGVELSTTTRTRVISSWFQSVRI